MRRRRSGRRARPGRAELAAVGDELARDRVGGVGGSMSFASAGVRRDRVARGDGFELGEPLGGREARRHEVAGRREADQPGSRRAFGGRCHRGRPRRCRRPLQGRRPRGRAGLRAPRACLMQGGAGLAEDCADLGPDERDRSDDHDSDQARDQRVFDRGRALGAQREPSERPCWLSSRRAPGSGLAFRTRPALPLVTGKVSKYYERIMANYQPHRPICRLTAFYLVFHKQPLFAGG